MWVPSVLWKRMSKVWSLDETVAERLPEESVVPVGVLLIEALSFVEGLPSGKSSKDGPLRRAPCQWVTSTEMMPSVTASTS